MDPLAVLVASAKILQTEGDDDTPTQYRILLAPEGVETGDGRIFLDGSLSWRDGRLPLMWSDSEMAHGDAVHVGNIDDIGFETIDDVKWAVGVVDWDSDDEAVEARRLVDEDRLTGVSVHLGEAEAEFICLEEDDDGFCVSVRLEFSVAQIAAATIVAIPAFEDAEVEPVAADSNMTVNVDGIHVFNNTPEGVALYDLYAPPREWFDDPNLDAVTPLTVTDDGRVYGHLALWDTCHTGFADVCVTPPRDGADFEEFHAHAIVLCEGGMYTPCGVITVDGSHADLAAGMDTARAHYDHTGTIGAYVRAGEDEHGIWVAGAEAPGLRRDVRERMRRNSLSGDWRPRNGRHVLIAALSVPVPGFPIRARVAAGAETGYWSLGPAKHEQPPSDLVLVASAIDQLRTMIKEVRSDLAPIVADRRAAEEAAVFAAFD